jgi:lipoic acid synthetase
VTPEEFAEYASQALQMGFAAVASDPFVRSSYHAGSMFENVFSRDVGACGNFKDKSS